MYDHRQRYRSGLRDQYSPCVRARGIGTDNRQAINIAGRARTPGFSETIRVTLVRDGGTMLVAPAFPCPDGRYLRS